MAKTARVVDSFGQPGRLKIRRIREHEAAGAGRWVGDTFVFTARIEADRSGPRCARRVGIRPAQRLTHSPTIGRITTFRVDQFSGRDSGFSMLPYPLASQRGSGPRYPTLARVGGGL